VCKNARMANESGTAERRAVLPAKERNRLTIMEAAQEVLRRDPDATLDEVAARAGVVRRTLYGHFAGRRELVVALVQAAAAEFTAEAGVCVPADDADVAEFRGAAARSLLRLRSTARRFELLITLAKRTADAEVRVAMAPHRERMVRLIARGQRAGAFGSHLPAEMLAELLHSHAEAHLAAARGGREDSSVADGVVGQLLTLGVPEEDARAAVAEATTAEASDG
jgi:AcrR family transcriptional regulator